MTDGQRNAEWGQKQERERPRDGSAYMDVHQQTSKTSVCCGCIGKLFFSVKRCLFCTVCGSLTAMPSNNRRYNKVQSA